MYRWIHQEKARYYQAHLIRDLFGDWTLITVWGSLGSHRGRMYSSGVQSYEAGLARLAAISKRRRQRGYLLVDGS
jgi:hypothetical protein